MKRSFTKYPSYVQAASETSGAAMRRKKREAEQRGREGSELLATDGEWELWSPKTHYGAVYIAKLYGGEYPRWDICYHSAPQWFDHTAKYGPIYIFVNQNSGEKYVSQPSTKSWFYDVYDSPKGEQALIRFLDEHPAFAEYFDITDDDVESCTDINASYSIPASNECVPYWQFDKAAIVEPLRELVKKIKDNLSQLGFVTSVGTSGFESVNADVIGVDVDIEIDKDVNELSADEINLIEGCGAEFGGRNFDI